MDKNKRYYYNDGNHNAAYNNPEFMTVISMNVSGKMGRQLTKGELTFVVNLIRKLDEDYLRSKDPQDVIASLSHVILTKLIEKGACPPMDGAEQIDIHEKLKEHIGTTAESNVSHSIYDRGYNLTSGKKILGSNISSFLGVSEPLNIIRKFNPNSLMRKNYFLLDSRYKNTTSTKSRFTWDYSNDKIQNTGTVNMIGHVRDIVAIRVYPFRLPYVSSADSKHRRISLLIHEFAPQSFFAHENRRFHVLMETSIDGSFIECNPYEQNNGYYYFDKPFTTFNSITISLGNPLQVIEFDKDKDKCSANYFIISPLTQITTDSAHNIQNGDLVYFSNFDVGDVDPILTEQVKINNNIKNIFNQPKGFLITIIDETNFSIDFDSSNIQNPLVGLKFDVFYDSKRFYVPVELEYLSPIER